MREEQEIINKMTEFKNNIEHYKMRIDNVQNKATFFDMEQRIEDWNEHITYYDEMIMCLEWVLLDRKRLN